MIELKRVSKDFEGNQTAKLEYSVCHFGEHTVLEGDLVAILTNSRVPRDAKVELVLTLGNCNASTMEEALDKMASWCERMADGLRERGNGITIYP